MRSSLPGKLSRGLESRGVMKIKEFQPTPNPNALKLVMDERIATAPRSYLKPAEAGDDSLAKSLFAVPGVTGLLFLDDFITINKSSESRWPDIKKAATAILKASGS